MLTWQLWCTLLCILWFYFLWSRRRFYRLIFQIPGPLGYPLVGMAHKLLNKEDVLPVFKHYLDKHGSLVFSWLGLMPFVLASDPQLAQEILNSQHCVNKCLIYKAIDDASGRGLFSLKEPHWSAHRRLINPAFALKVLQSFLPIFNAETTSLLKVVDSLVDCGEKNLIPLMRSLALNISTQTTMGSEVNCSEYIKNNKLLEAYRSLLKTVTDMCLSPWLLSRTVRQLLGREKKYAKAKTQINGFLFKLIESKLAKGSEAHLETEEDKNIFLNLATDLVHRGIFTKQEVKNHSANIVFAAFETTTNTVVYTLILLAMFPEYQEKAFQEPRSLFPSTGDFEVTYRDTQNMVYLDLIMNESMRVLAPVPIVARQTMQDVRLSNGVVIPKGVQIVVDIFHLHRDKKVWGENAETFNPDHFLPIHMQDRHPYSFIPFTKGIRNCIGWRYALISIKVILAKLLRNYKFSTSFKFEDFEFVEDITLEFKTVPLLEIQRRNC
ncbi:probable cytochrome P450 313a4 isoform X4 [Drosophila nasuta]|uniref:probable cytochrome P450 313a4 isoform X4 n=2 Tax=Drosophila nasuta TaxID=42062 RepID=UPI00295EC18E|nr:probable cytochrome P450 313a4 isoform X4 [Drosophila nasuta]